MRVLVIDDDPNCRQILQLMLAKQGWTIVLAENAIEGLARCAECTPDLVLMDILMPRMSGLEAVGRMRCLPGVAHTPIVAITALAFEQDRLAALAAGFDGVITKPFSRRQLNEGIHAFFPGSSEAPADKVPA